MKTLTITMRMGDSRALSIESGQDVTSEPRLRKALERIAAIARVEFASFERAHSPSNGWWVRDGLGNIIGTAGIE